MIYKCYKSQKNSLMLTRHDSFFYLKIKHRPFTDFFLTAARSKFFFLIKLILPGESSSFIVSLINYQDNVRLFFKLISMA